MRTTLRTFLLAALLLNTAAIWATSIQRLPDGTCMQYGHLNGVPHLAQWTSGAWAPIAVAAELVPAKGEYEGVTADAQGNLFVSYTDETNAKKKVGGLLARVGGTWSLLGALPKGCSGRSLIAALSPTDVYVDTWLTEERRSQLLHWNGSAFAVVPLPPATEEVNGLQVHDAGLVMLAYGRGPSGNYSDASSAFLLKEGGWERMGVPAAENTDLLFTGADGALWRMGRVAERWSASGWARGFTFDHSSSTGYRITDASPGTKGELYLVLQGPGSKDHLACWPGSGDLLWLKGTPQTAMFQYGAYDLFVDAEGVVHVNDKERYTFADFDFAADGYPTRDDKAREVFDLFNAQTAAYKTVSDPFLEAYSAFNTSKSASDFQQLTKAADKAQDWFSTAIVQLEGLGIGPTRNRLYDAQLAMMKAMKDQQHYMYLQSEALHKGTDFMAPSKDLMDANRRQVNAIEAMEKATKGYAARNWGY